MKILLIRFSSIGDIVLTTPVIRCVKEQIPGAEVHFLTKNKFKTLVANNPHVDVIKELTENNTPELIQDLKKEEYDLVIDLHKNLRTSKIKRALKVKWISFNKLNLQKWLFVNFKINLLPEMHIVDRYFKELKDLNVFNDNKGLDYFFPNDFTINKALGSIVPEQYTVISIGGTYFTKQMPNKLIISIINQLNAPIILIGGGPVDEAKAQEIMDNIQDDKVINMCNILSIDESAHIIKHAKNLITGDTGMMHIGAAFNTTIHSIWGNTHSNLGMYAYRPNGKTTVFNHRVNLKCNPCSKLGSDTCPRGHFNCMQMQNVEQIVHNCVSEEAIQ